MTKPRLHRLAELEIREAAAYILAVAHQSREPRYWVRRNR